MDILREVTTQIGTNKAEMVTSLSRLISIPSVAIAGEGESPFGENVQRVYDAMLDMARQEGFSVFNADNYGGHIDFEGSEDGIVGIVGHLDVVPEGDNWDFDPYGGEVIDGNVCGRGAVDDKGPVIASFYAMKALKECGYEPKRTVRMILGLDEETNWEGMEYYLEKVSDVPDFGFTPDGDFPAIHGEMGILVFDIIRKLSQSGIRGMQLSSLRGGTAANSVADFARAVLHNSAGTGYDDVKDIIKRLREEKNYKINYKGIGKSLEITVRGVSAHGAKPQQGLNAISVMMEILGHVNFANEDTNDIVAFYNRCIGFDIHGENLGCDISDEQSGRLVLNVGMAEIDKKTAKFTINVRYPVTSSDETVYDMLTNVLEHYDMGVVKGKHQPPIFIPKDDALIVTLMDIYRKHTGDMESEPLVIGGGTYARAVDNTVAFGARFPGEPELGHQRNELISIDNLVKLTEIYAEAIYRLAEME